MSPSAPSLPTPRVTCTKTLKASHALVQPGHPGTQVTSFVHLIRRWAPFISEFTRYPYSHKEDTEDSVPLHLTLDDYKRGLKPFALMRPFMSEGWEKAWTGEGECPLMRFAGSETPQAGSTIGGGCWYFREEVLIEGSEAMSKAICKALHHLRDLGIIQFDPSLDFGEHIDIHADPDSAYFQDARYQAVRPNKANVALHYPRRWAGLLNIVFYAVTLIAYEGAGDDMKIWVAKRGANKKSLPGMLDNTVTGGVSAGQTEMEGLVMEAREEASIPEEIVREHSKCFGAISMISGGGGADVHHMYKLELPRGHGERTLKLECPTDEVEEFKLVPAKELLDELRYHPERYAYWAGAQFLLFLMSEGIVNPANEPHYLEISARLQQDFCMLAKRVSW